MRRRNPAVRREIAWRDGHGLAQEDDGLGPVTLAREVRGAVAKGEDRGGDVLELHLRAREAAERFRVAVLRRELPIGLLGLTELSGREELRRGVERQARRGALLRLRVGGAGPRSRGGRARRGERRDAEAGHSIAELARALRVHDPCGGQPRALGERREVPRRERVRGALEGAELLRQELLRRGPEVLLRDLQDLGSEVVHSSPGSSANA